MAQNSQFLEIEFKWVLQNLGQVDSLRAQLHQKTCLKKFSVSVDDTYFFSPRYPDLIFRHRVDPLLQQLTVKSAFQGDVVVRREINLALAQAAGSQIISVQAFLCALDPQMKQAAIQKDVEVFEFLDHEIVIYRATHESSKKSLWCLEVEVTKFTTPESAMTRLSQLAEEIQLDPKDREPKSLFELLIGTTKDL
jgi:hypothetical protein